MTYRLERAISPINGHENFVVIDEQFAFHPESTAFLVWLSDTRSSSRNSVRAYGGRVATFLNWTNRHGVDWKTVSLTELTWYKRWLEETPVGKIEVVLNARRHGLQLRSGSTVNAHITGVSEFIRYAAREGIVEQRIASQLSQQRYMRTMPRNFNAGEDDQFRTIRARVLVAPETEPALKLLSDDEVDELVSMATNERDKFLIRGLRATGLRIGEQLGLRRDDMHLLPTSRHLGCDFAGAHIHVIRRMDNDNAAVGKSKRTRIVPVDNDYVAAYREYQ